MVGLIESPEENIQLDVRSTSSWMLGPHLVGRWWNYSYLVQRVNIICIEDDGRPRGEVEFSKGIDVNDEQQRT